MPVAVGTCNWDVVHMTHVMHAYSIQHSHYCNIYTVNMPSNFSSVFQNALGTCFTAALPLLSTACVGCPVPALLPLQFGCMGLPRSMPCHCHLIAAKPLGVGSGTAALHRGTVRVRITVLLSLRSPALQWQSQLDGQQHLSADAHCSVATMVCLADEDFLLRCDTAFQCAANVRCQELVQCALCVLSSSAH